jgi:chemotaxis protein MotB
LIRHSGETAWFRHEGKGFTKGAALMKSKVVVVLSLVVLFAMMATGCSNKELIQQKDTQSAELQSELDQLQGDLEAERARTGQLQSDLDNALSDMRSKEQVWMEEKNGLTQVTIDGEVTFSSGSTRLTTEGKEILNRIFDVVEQYPDRSIMIEGHTDNVPIAERFQSRYRSNWELSSARAHTVLHYVQKKYNIDSNRIGAVGYGEFRPIATNDTKDGQAMNRRVVITIAPMPKASKMYP